MYFCMSTTSNQTKPNQPTKLTNQPTKLTTSNQTKLTNQTNQLRNQLRNHIRPAGELGHIGQTDST
jgi:hypothetical protein